MKVTVTPRVVSGTDRGGEDLFLDFAADEFDTGPLQVELGDGDPSWDFADDYDEDEDGNPTPESTVSCCTGHYEFEWKGTFAQLVALVRETGVTSEQNWRWTGPASSPPVKVFRHEHFVAGNAD